RGRELRGNLKIPPEAKNRPTWRRWGEVAADGTAAAGCRASTLICAMSVPRDQIADHLRAKLGKNVLLIKSAFGVADALLVVPLELFERFLDHIHGGRPRRLAALWKFEIQVADDGMNLG